MTTRASVIQCLGKFPEKTDPAVQVLMSWDKGDHILSKIAYHVEANERVEAYLLEPAVKKEKMPGILAIHQHAGEYYLGKSEPAGLSRNAMYHYGLDLVLRGYVVLCPDHLCFEDRRPVEYSRAENAHLEGGAYERLMFCKYIAEGSSLQTKYLHDLSVALDVLCALRGVDAKRIGAIGHSLGGQETLWLTWYDERICASVASCGFSQIRSIFREGINHNLAMFVPGFFNIGDMADLVCHLAPRPFLMTHGTEDPIFPMDGVREIAAAAGAAYAASAHPERFQSIVFEGGHSFPPDVKKAAYDWLDQYLK